MGEAAKVHPDYKPQTAGSLKDYLARLPDVASRLGGKPDGWTVEEVGDGNLNLVFIVKGPSGGIAVKQALPYVRLVGEAWPLPLSRAHYEYMTLTHHGKAAPGLTPTIYHYDEAMALIVMELLQPHIIMRRGMIAGTVYPLFAGVISTYMANTLFATSDMALSAKDKKALIGDFAGNTALCKITEDLIFTDPYRIAELNRWTKPWLDGHAAAFRSDGPLKVAVSRLKVKFLSSAEALIHGDLHTGSVMLTEQDTRIIDPEFAFVGPMGFDVGAVIANLVINYLSQVGHEEKPGARDAYRDWVLRTAEEVWVQFRAKFIANWEKGGIGDAYPRDLFAGAEGQRTLAAEREAYMDRLWQDTVGFASAKMIRRVLGLAHNIDLEWIKDERLRATAEARVLELARDMMVNTGDYRKITDITAAARKANASQPKLTG
ncbi:MAG: S-methyl-5-thioribose kinase [Proteobacteria bacterium]|nr:S-methyl-5-thioribose kinase [Pseudomonadota bacterium]